MGAEKKRKDDARAEFERLTRSIKKPLQDAHAELENLSTAVDEYCGIHRSTSGAAATTGYLPSVRRRVLASPETPWLFALLLLFIFVLCFVLRRRFWKARLDMARRPSQSRSPLLEGDKLNWH